MKVVVGIDEEGHYLAALSLLACLKFPNLEAELVHAEEPFNVWSPELYSWIAEMEEERKRISTRLLEKASDEAKRLGVSCTTTRLGGYAAQVLLRRAEETNADLIAIGSAKKSKYGALFLGSVGRTLAISAPQSLLIAKSAPEQVGSLKAVFATDHSEYARKAENRFVAFHPEGLRRLRLLTACQEPDIESEHREHMVTVHDLEMDRLCYLSEGAVKRLKDAGLPADFNLVSGDVHEAIIAEMDLLDADLLILGALGHGFWERLWLGSTALQEVVATPHSVLLLRPKTEG